MKVAALQYRYDPLHSFEEYQRKISQIVSRVASQGVNLLLFPEYAGFEMVSFATFNALQGLIPSYLDLFQRLSQEYQMYICTGTQIVRTEKGTFNRSYFFSPQQKVSYQDKCTLTPYEIGEGILSAGNFLRLFETTFGKVGICVCYDVEFPALVEKLVEKGAKLILVPSYTASVHGFYRVFTSCRARALESQCYVVQSSLVGKTDIEIAYGASTICSPIDDGFKEDGIIAMGTRDQPEIVTAELDLDQLESVRKTGQTLNYHDHQILKKRMIQLETLDMR